MKFPRNRMRLSVALAGTLSAVVPLTVTAQLEEVVVTANKRATSLQDIPLAISVVDAQIVQRSEIRDLLDLQSVVPSLRVPQFQNSVQTNFVIRGFGNGANNPGIEPSVAVFIDGVYRSRSLSRISDLPNIEQIEVLRGPQSTLYGKNASAGVILVNTAKPEFETTGHIEGGVGNYNQRSVRGYVTGPLSDSVAASFGGSSLQRDGYYDNVALGTELNDRDRWALRGELMFDISESTELRVAVDFDELEEACCGTTNLYNGPAGGALAALSIVPGIAYSTEPYEYETKYKTTPWAEITSSSVLESNVPGLPVGASYTDDNDVICSEDLLSDLTIDIEIGMDASTKGRESMHYRLSFDVAMWTMDSFGVPQDVNRNKTNSSIPINWEGTTSITLDANLDATGNRSDENWRVSISLVSMIFLDNYEGIESNYIIDSRGIWWSWCDIDSTVEDPDVMETNKGESSGKSLPSIGPIMSIATILLAAMRRSESVDFDKL